VIFPLKIAKHARNEQWANIILTRKIPRRARFSEEEIFFAEKFEIHARAQGDPPSPELRPPRQREKVQASSMAVFASRHPEPGEGPKWIRARPWILRTAQNDGQKKAVGEGIPPPQPGSPNKKAPGLHRAPRE
jgi:hypothetical protein